MKFRYNEKRNGKTVSSSSLIDEFVKAFNLESHFSFELLCSEWEKIAGPILSVHTKPLSFDREILLVSSDHSVFSNDIIMMKGKIINTMKSLYGQNVKDIKIVTRK